MFTKADLEIYKIDVEDIITTSDIDEGKDVLPDDEY